MPGAWTEVAALAANIAKARGYAVFPCAESKLPTVKDWPNRAATSEIDIARLWFYHPGPLIGIVTGERSGIDVLDFDVKHDEALHWWHSHREKIPRTLAYRTRSGGMHLYFAHAEGVRNTASKIAKGVDTRGTGGFAVCWFAAGLPCLNQAPVVPWPDWLLERLLRKPPPAQEARRGNGGGYSGPAPTDLAIHGIVRRVVNTSEGERNTILNWAAWRMRHRVANGELSAAEAASLLTQAARDAGLDAVEAAKTIASGLGSGGA